MTDDENARKFNTLKIVARVVSIVISVVLGLLTRASGTDLKGLFQNVTILLVMDAALIVFVLRTNPKNVWWMVLVPAVLAFACYAALAARVYHLG